MTKIEWTHVPDGKGGFKRGETLNPQVGCREKSRACRRCYAAKTAHLHAKSIPQHRGLTVVTSNGVHWNGKINRTPSLLAKPLRWREPRGIFLGSMTDTFLDVDTDDDMRWIAAILGVAAATPQHTWMLLTKRPDNAHTWFEWVERAAREFEPLLPMPHSIWRFLGHCVAELVGADEWADGLRRSKRTNGVGVAAWPLPNVWLGVTAENQARADETLPELLRCPAAVRFVSYEPACGPVDFTPWMREQDSKTPAIDWLIAGGESGPGAEAAHPEWFRSVRNQCVEHHVPFFFKQWGEWAPTSDDWTHVVFDDGEVKGRATVYEEVDEDDHETILCTIADCDGEPIRRVGKGKSGRLLDGRTWDEFPEVAGG